MAYVYLVCTVHEERGLANVTELSAILETIRPDVIFVEVPREGIGDYLATYRQQSLEARAIGRYRQGHQVEIIPVDLPTPDEEFFRSNRYLFESIEQTSQEYRRPIDSHSNLVGAYGFRYLNGEGCIKLWSAVYEEARRTIKTIGDPRLIELFELWEKTNGRRDSEMTENILSYCRMSAFDVGVFLVGAAHRQSINERVKEQTARNPDAVKWRFSSVAG